METRKFDFFSKKFEICLLTKSWNHLSFVNISPTLVIDTSMERSSRVLQHGNPKIIFFFKKVRNSNFDFWQRAEITLASSIQSYISNWYINGMVFTSTTPWKPRKVKFFQKVWNRRNWILSVPRVTVCRETKSPWLRQYQSYISNWYINGKVFTSTTPWKPKNLIFLKSSKFEFWLLTKSWNHLSFVNISPTLVIDTSMERSLQVLHHRNPKICFFFSKKFKIRILTFDEELKSP